MILTCPSCTMRFLVSEGAIGPKGRRVRCANCGHEWRQEPEQGLDEELFGEAPSFLEEHPDDFHHDLPPAAEDDSDDFQSILRKEIESSPIPAGVHPDLNDPVLEQLKKDKKAIKIPSGDRISGFIVAAAFWLAVAALFLFMQPQISRAWPPANLVYDLVGMKPVLPGEGLALDNLHAEMADGKIVMKGAVFNLKEKPVKVPAIMASIVDADDKVIDRMLIPPPLATLKGEGQTTFAAEYAKIPDGAKNVTFAFSFMKAKASAKEKKAEETKPAEEPPKEEAAAPQHPAPHH